MNRIKNLALIVGKLLLMLVFVFILLIILFIAYFFAAGLTTSEIGGLLESDLLIYTQNAAFIAAVLTMYALFERRKGWNLGLRQQRSVLLSVHGLLAGFILISAASVLIWALGGVEWQWIGLNREVRFSLLEGLALFIGVALAEEILSRGYIQGLIKYHYGSIAAITASSILFALMHGFNPGVFESPFPILNILLAGILFALSRELTGGLWMPIGLHLTWNYFQGYIYGFSVSGTDPIPSVLRAVAAGPAALSGGSFGVEGSSISTIILVLGIIAVYYFYRGKEVKLTHSTIV